MAIILAIAGIACAGYGVAVLMVNSGTPFFAVWFGLAALFLLAAWAVHAGWWAAAPAAVRRAVLAVVGVAAVWLIATQALALSAFGAHGDDAGDDLDFVIVLGAQVRETGPSAVLQYRLDTAAEYLAAHPGTRCIVSGGQGPNESEPEAHAMARYLESCGIDGERIIVEDRALNTDQNIRNSMAYLDAERDRVGIVTNDFHVFRGVALARKRGIANAVGIAAPSNPFYLPNNLLRESFGITKDFLAGNLGMRQGGM